MFFYFESNKLLSKLANTLRPDGRLAILYMAWLPEEDPIAQASEPQILQYNPLWTGAGKTRPPIALPWGWIHILQKNGQLPLTCPFRLPERLERKNESLQGDWRLFIRR